MLACVHPDCFYLSGHPWPVPGSIDGCSQASRHPYWDGVWPPMPDALSQRSRLGTPLQPSSSLGSPDERLLVTRLGTPLQPSSSLGSPNERLLVTRRLTPLHPIGDSSSPDRPTRR